MAVTLTEVEIKELMTGLLNNAYLETESYEYLKK